MFRSDPFTDLDRGAQVECKDCTGVQPQLSTINLATISWATDEKRDIAQATATPTTIESPRPPPNDYVKASLRAAMKRVEKYLTMDNEEFMSRWDVPGTMASVTAASTP